MNTVRPPSQRWILLHKHDQSIVFRRMFLWEENRLALQGLLDDLIETNVLFGRLGGKKIFGMAAPVTDHRYIYIPPFG